eukprot:scaffold15600_cov80-Isochrysis_galbana.AAC.1
MSAAALVPASWGSSSGGGGGPAAAAPVAEAGAAEAAACTPFARAATTAFSSQARGPKLTGRLYCSIFISLSRYATTSSVDMSGGNSYPSMAVSTSAGMDACSAHETGPVRSEEAPRLSSASKSVNAAPAAAAPAAASSIAAASASAAASSSFAAVPASAAEGTSCTSSPSARCAVTSATAPGPSEVAAAAPPLPGAATQEEAAQRGHCALRRAEQPPTQRCLGHGGHGALPGLVRGQVGEREELGNHLVLAHAGVGFVEREELQREAGRLDPGSLVECQRTPAAADQPCHPRAHRCAAGGAHGRRGGRNVGGRQGGGEGDALPEIVDGTSNRFVAQLHGGERGGGGLVDARGVCDPEIATIRCTAGGAGAEGKGGGEQVESVHVWFRGAEVDLPIGAEGLWGTHERPGTGTGQDPARNRPGTEPERKPTRASGGERATSNRVQTHLRGEAAAPPRV